MRSALLALIGLILAATALAAPALGQEQAGPQDPTGARSQTLGETTPKAPPIDGRLAGPLVGPQSAPNAAGPQTPRPASSETPAAEARALAEFLKNAESRDRLIQELERLAGGAPAAGETASSAPSSAPSSSAGPSAGAAEGAEEIGEEAFSIRAVADSTRRAAKGFLSDAARFARRVINIPYAFKGLTGEEFKVLYDAFLDLALLIGVTGVVFVALRVAAFRLYRAMGAQAQGADWAHKAALVILSTLIDAGLVLVAWGAGFAVASFALGQPGEVDIRHSLFLNAFLLVEMAKLLIRLFLSPAAPPLRLIAMPDHGAWVLCGWLSAVISLVGYGQFLAAPILAKNVSVFAGRAFSAFVLLAALLIMVILVLSSRRDVAAWLLGRKRLHETRRGLLVALARYWHVPALIYLIGFFISVMITAGGKVLPVVSASAQMLLAVLFGVMAAQALKRRIADGVHLPEQWNQRLPLLEGRLNAVLPRALFVIRILIIFAVVAFIADTLSLIEARNWLTSQVGARFAGGLVSISLILLAVFAAWLALSSYVEFRLNPNFGSTPTAREQTLLTLLRNAITVALIVITLMVILSELGLDIAPLIASAGVLGLAIGIGSQKLVQDIITGVFIQLESAINVGDVITVAGVTGVVEQLTIRSVSLRDLEGTYHIIPFSSIDMVSNFNRDYAYHLMDMGIAYSADVDAAKQAMLDAFQALRETTDWRFYVYGELEWFGLESFGDSAVVLRARIKCAPGKQWAVGRAYKEIVKRLFDERGIEIPFPHRTVILERRGPARASAPDGETAKPPAAPGPEQAVERFGEGQTVGEPDAGR